MRLQPLRDKLASCHTRPLARASYASPAPDTNEFACEASPGELQAKGNWELRLPPWQRRNSIRLMKKHTFLASGVAAMLLLSGIMSSRAVKGAGAQAPSNHNATRADF